MCINWSYVGKTKEDKMAKGALFFSTFRHLSRYSFESMVNDIISDTTRRDVFPTIAQMRNIEKANKAQRERVECDVCDGAGLVSMLHVFKKPIGHDDKPAYVLYADAKVQSKLRHDGNVKAYCYAYRCKCKNGQPYGSGELSQDMFDEIREFKGTLTA